jgi:hypothetical protein
VLGEKFSWGVEAFSWSSKQAGKQSEVVVMANARVLMSMILLPDVAFLARK